MYTLCVAEKPSVAEEIAHILNADKKNTAEGYYEGNGYLVTWCVGHLVGLAEPEAYSENFRMWSMDVIPLIPAKWKLTIIENTKHQFYNVKKLLNREDVELVIDCGDYGPQGHYIQWLVRVMSGCKKPVKKLCAKSITDNELRRAFTELEDINKFNYIIVGQFTKAKADWIIGMCLSRYFSVKYRENLNKGEVLSVGRVQSATWNFVVERYYEIKNFVPKPYYQLQITTENGVKAIYYDGNNNKIDDEYKAKEIEVNLRKQNKACVENVIIEHKMLNRPQLYDITSIQRDGSRLYDYSPEEVLQALQNLYEKKLMTYPRTDSRYLNTDVAEEMQQRIQDISLIKQYSVVAETLLKKGLNLDKRIVDNKKIEDHHALIVTENIKNVNFLELTTKEKNILNLVISRMLLAFDTVMKYDETRVYLNVAGHVFQTSGITVVDEGWKKTEKKLFHKQEKQNDNLPKMDIGEEIPVTEINRLCKKTQPPQPYTYDTLLAAMKNAGDKIEIGDEMVPMGIGTGATRAGIIGEIYKKGFLENFTKDKRSYINPTRKALFASTVFPKSLLSPEMTARWQYKINQIEQKELSADVFIEEVKHFVAEIINEAEKNTTSYNGLFSDNQEVVGKCRWCGEKIYQKGNIYKCENEKCGFFISAEKNAISLFHYKKPLSFNQIKKLLSDKGLTLECKSKVGNQYTANFKIKAKPKFDGEKKYPDIYMTFVPRKVKKDRV